MICCYNPPIDGVVKNVCLHLSYIILQSM